MSKIYIVYSSEGVCEDYHEWPEKAFFNKEDAIKFSKQLDKAHELIKPDFVDDKFEDIYDEGWSSEFLTDCNRADYEKHMVKYLQEHGYPDFDKDKLKLYNEYECNRYQMYHPCHIIELDLE